MKLASICFGIVRHARLKPVQNEFRYGVFHLRIPMMARAQSKTGIAQLGLGDNSFSWLSFYDKDHGNGDQNSLKWAQDLAQQFGIQTDLDEIWLHTFPRVLGYVFNPVSFWFYTNKDKQTIAILAEVNNTFGERHCYFLKKPDLTPIVWGETLEAQKIFHVSPFCDVAGKYLFRFGSFNGQHIARIEYHHEGPLLITSISGLEKNIELSQLIWSALRYPAMSIGVIVRIHWQALKLWIKGVKFYSKPNPPTMRVSE